MTSPQYSDRNVSFKAAAEIGGEMNLTSVKIKLQMSVITPLTNSIDSLRPGGMIIFVICILAYSITVTTDSTSAKSV